MIIILWIININDSSKSYPLLNIDNPKNSELTGMAFSPNNKFLYFSSQRGTDGENGITYCVEGDFTNL